MRFKQNGNKKDIVAVVVRNDEASASIPRGTPVTLVLDGTEDGVAVVLPSTAGDAKNGAFKYGIAVNTIAAGDYGESQVFGHCSYAILTRATRAATSDSWTSSQSQDSGIALGWDSINNALVMNASAVGSLGTLHANCVLASSISSIAASATATSLTLTAITVAAKVFIRMMG
jgi:hypothetical protein